jgi:hypothetical protein
VDSRTFEEPNAPLAVVRRRLHGIEEPTMARNAVAPNTAFVQDTLGRLSKIRIPLRAPAKVSGLDGYEYELHIGDFWAGIGLRWWLSAPAEWEAVENVMQFLLKHLEARFEETKKAESGDADFPTGTADI